jgi:hypothetical protein
VYPVLAPLFALTALAFALAPFIVLYLVAESWGQSKLHVFWGFLSWTGLIAGIIVMAILRGQAPNAASHPEQAPARTIR